MFREEKNHRMTPSVTLHAQPVLSGKTWQEQIDPGIRFETIKAWVRDYGSPLHVYSEAAIDALVSGFLEFALANQRQARTAFALKACPSAAILKLMHQRGLLAEVNSVHEYKMAIDAGFAPQEIHINGVAKSVSLLDMAVQKGCRALHIDSVEEIDILAARTRLANQCINLQLRICPDVTSGRNTNLMTGSRRSQFGLTQEDVPLALQALQAHRGVLNLVGLHVHIGSGGELAGAYPQLIKVLQEVLATCLQADFTSVQEMNLGGGFVSDHACFSQVSGAASLQAEIRKLPAELNLLFEPGRFLVEHAGALYCQVAAMKRKGNSNWIFLDAGYAHLTDRAIVNACFPMRVLQDSAECMRVRVAGPLCDAADVYQSEDQIEQEWMFPSTTQIGDVVEIAHAGAYVYGTGNHFAGMSQPAVILVRKNGHAHLIRRAEQFADLRALEV